MTDEEFATIAHLIDPRWIQHPATCQCEYCEIPHEDPVDETPEWAAE